MTHHHHHVFSAEKASLLQSGLRKLLMNPARLLAPFVKESMVVLDVGCGPGFFTVEAARMVGPGGKVIAADLQQAMLEKVREAVKDNEIGRRIVLHRCSEEQIGITESVDLILAIHVVHELPDREKFFREMKSIIRQSGVLLLMEPAFIVPGREFCETLNIATSAGFRLIERKRKILSNVAILKV